MSFVRLLAFETLGCGCVAGHYRETASLRAITYIEEKAGSCGEDTHRRNHAVPPRRAVRPGLAAGLAGRSAAPTFRYT